MSKYIIKALENIVTKIFEQFAKKDTKSLSKIDITKHILPCLKAIEGDHKGDGGGSIIFKYIWNVKEEFNLELVKNCTHTVKRNENARKAMANLKFKLEVVIKKRVRRWSC